MCAIYGYTYFHAWLWSFEILRPVVHRSTRVYNLLGVKVQWVTGLSSNYYSNYMECGVPRFAFTFFTWSFICRYYLPEFSWFFTHTSAAETPDRWRWENVWIEGQKMKIFVKTLKGTHFEIEVKSEDTVSTISPSFYLVLWDACFNFN